MKVSRTFRLNDETMEKLRFCKKAYNLMQRNVENKNLNIRSFSTATVLEKLIEREYESLKEKGF